MASSFLEEAHRGLAVLLLVELLVLTEDGDLSHPVEDKESRELGDLVTF